MNSSGFRKTTYFFVLTLIGIELVQRTLGENMPCTPLSTSVICTNADGDFLINVRSENITAITIMGSKLTYLSEKDFSKFTNVSEIIIDKCEVPPRILKYVLSLKKLKVLQIMYSNITEYYFTALQNSSTLVRLYMKGNKIVFIKNGVFDQLSRLEEIDLSHNEISTIEADSFKGLKALRRLDLSHNMLSDDFDPQSLSLPTGCVFQSLVATCPAPTTDGHPSGEHQRPPHGDNKSQEPTEQQHMGQELDQQKAQLELDELHEMLVWQAQQIEQLMEKQEQQKKEYERRLESISRAIDAIRDTRVRGSDTQPPVSQVEIHVLLLVVSAVLLLQNWNIWRNPFVETCFLALVVGWTSGGVIMSFFLKI